MSCGVLGSCRDGRERPHVRRTTPGQHPHLRLPGGLVGPERPVVDVMDQVHAGFGVVARQRISHSCGREGGVLLPLCFPCAECGSWADAVVLLKSFELLSLPQRRYVLVVAPLPHFPRRGFCRVPVPLMVRNRFAGEGTLRSPVCGRPLVCGSFCCAALSDLAPPWGLVPVRNAVTHLLRQIEGDVIQSYWVWCGTLR